MFLRGRPALCFQMKRQKVKGTGHKQPADVNTEPNFYRMPAVEPRSVPTSTDAAAAATTGTYGYDPSHFHVNTGGATANTMSHVDRSSSTSPEASSPRVGPEMSPGISTVQGAAHLLRGIASGDRGRRLPNAPFLGLAEESLPMTSQQYQARQYEVRRGASMLSASQATAAQEKPSAEKESSL